MPATTAFDEATAHHLRRVLADYDRDADVSESADGETFYVDVEPVADAAGRAAIREAARRDLDDVIAGRAPIAAFAVDATKVARFADPLDEDGDDMDDAGATRH